MLNDRRSASPDVQLVPRRQPDLDCCKPDYAEAQPVGRICQTHSGGWLWSMTSVMYDDTVGLPMKDYATSFAEAKADLPAEDEVPARRSAVEGDGAR